LGHEPEIEPTSTNGTGTPGIQASQYAGQRWRKVTVVWVIVASGGLLVFAAGLFAIAHPISHHPEMYFYVNDDQGQSQPSAFPAERGYFCDLGFIFSTCGGVDANEFDPQVPAFAKDQAFEVWLVRSKDYHGCHAIAIRVEGKQYTTSELGWLAPLDAATPWALLLGFFGIVSSTYSLARRKTLVVVLALILLGLVAAVTFYSSQAFFGGCWVTA
jgi:hypothetical protein